MNIVEAAQHLFEAALRAGTFHIVDGGFVQLLVFHNKAERDHAVGILRKAKVRIGRVQSSAKSIEFAPPHQAHAAEVLVKAGIKQVRGPRSG